MARWISFSFLLLLAAVPASGQVVEDFDRTNLADLIPGFLSGGFRFLDVPGAPDGSGEFIDDASPQLALLGQLTAAFAGQVSAFPNSSSAGGFVYEFDPTLGVFTRASDSFGPVYGERATTVGESRFNVGMGYTYLSFDSIDGLNLRDGDIDLVFPHVDENDDGSRLTPYFEGDVISAQLFLKTQVTVTAFTFTYGVTDRLDLGLAVPLVDVDIQASAQAQIQRLATGDDSDIHTFVNDDDSTVARAEGSATGLGDVLLRGKLNLRRGERSAIAVAADVRAPTGEARDLLGAGEWQVEGQLLVSGHGTEVAPHASLSFSRGGGDTPDQINLKAGVEWVAHPRVTLSTTFLGRQLRDVGVVRERQEVFQANTNSGAGSPTVESTSLPVFGVTFGENVTTTTLAIGLKLNVAANLLLTANGLIAFGEDGLQDTFTPLVGLDYSF